MKYIKKFENVNEYNVGDYIGYKRYLGFPPMIVKILSINKCKNWEIGNWRPTEYSVELLESPHTKYTATEYELEELTDEQIEELNAYLNAEKYNL